MSDLATLSALQRTLADLFQNWQLAEADLRTQFANGSPLDRAGREMLERPTRRHLIDGTLRALGWNADHPAIVVEEASTRGTTGDRLFFDYLGVGTADRRPVILVEAKAYDAPLARPPRKPAGSAEATARLIAEAINVIKLGRTPEGLLAEWVEILRTMRAYVESLDPVGRDTLLRAVVTAGQWTVVIKDPSRVMLGTMPAGVDDVTCFNSAQEILQRCGELHALTARASLVADLNLVQAYPEALEWLDGGSIEARSRGALITTTETGAKRGRRPCRVVYPLILICSGGRWFAIVNHDAGADEPRCGSGFDAFEEAIESLGARLEADVAFWTGPLPPPTDVHAFPGLPAATVPVTAIALRGGPATAKLLAVQSDEPEAVGEFVVATGEHWYQKTARQAGPPCPFHSRAAARQGGIVSDVHEGYSRTAFTDDGEEQHCAHGGLLAARRPRCQVTAFDTNACCRACRFEPVCWPSAHERRPCPGIDGAASPIAK